jgi:Leucine-rich repeat (LRR) protein
MSDEKLPLTLHSGSALVQIGPQGGRILAEMVNGALVLSRATGSSAALMRRFRIGTHELCEPDYQQILLWANSLKLEPKMVIERLLAKPKSISKRGPGTKIVNGRIIKLGLDMGLLPLVTFEWVKGLIIEDITFFVPEQHELVKRSLSLQLPELRSLNCNRVGFSILDLSSVPQLTSLNCGGNQLTKLDLSAVPLLTSLYCWANQLTELELSAVPVLTSLHCGANQLTKLDLSGVPLLTSLYCGFNQLSELKLAVVPLLTSLECGFNELAELDMRALRNLSFLFYSKDKTRLIQRPDQDF